MGRLTRSINSEGQRYETYTYDKAGNRVTSSYQLDGEQAYEKEYEYYENSDLLKRDGTYGYTWENTPSFWVAREAAI